MSSELASITLQRLLDEGQFAVFELPVRTAFVQAIRTSNGSLLIELSRADPALEILLQRLGQVSTNELGFPKVVSDRGNDAACGEVVAQALAVLANSVGCENVCRVRTGTSKP